MKSLSVIFIFLEFLSQVRCSHHSPSESVTSVESELSEDFKNLIEAVSREIPMNSKRKWDLMAELAVLKKNEKKISIRENFKEQFWQQVIQGNPKGAETIRDQFRIFVTPTDDFTFDHLSGLLSCSKTNLNTLDYLYQNFPEIFRFKYLENVFTNSKQLFLNHLFEEYSFDSELMDRLLEACCLNHDLTLPDEFFMVNDPDLALRNISIVKSFGPVNPNLLKKCYELPLCNLDLKFSNGESVLTDALKSSGSLELILTILKRSDIGILAKIRDPNGELPSEIAADTSYDKAFDGKITRALKSLE